MKPLIIAGTMLSLFGAMEVYRDHRSDLGFLLLFGGVMLLMLHYVRTRARKDESASITSDIYFEPLQKDGNISDKARSFDTDSDSGSD